MLRVDIGVLTKDFNVLCLNNNFYGSYESSQVFYRELILAFKNIGVNVLEANDWQSAEKICNNFTVDFSVSFGKYCYQQEDFFYNRYNIPHYQWISDNPLKMNLDTSSSLVTYIFIDEEYTKMIPQVGNFLILPLGFPEKKFLNFSKRTNKILIPCKIRNLNKLWQTISDSSQGSLIKEFLFDYSLDDSYITRLTKFFKQKNIVDAEDKILIFRLSNEFLRIQKRLSVINSLSDYKVYIAGEDYRNTLKYPDKVIYLKPIKYQNLFEAMQNFKIVVNVDPNYHACIHDRFVRAVGSGCICLTNQNFVMERWNDNVYTFDGKKNVNDLVCKVMENDEEIFLNQSECIKNFSWESSAKKIIEHYLNGTRINCYAI